MKLGLGNTQRSSERIVIGVMRRFARGTSVLFIAITACTRPMLYYPGASTAPSPAPAPAATPASAPAEHHETNPALMTVAVNGASMSDVDYLRSRSIVVPVAGADMHRVEDSFGDPRDGERMHRAIDILAPRGTPILSADDGKILRMSTSTLGGISMYTVDPAGRLVYYYAHMDHYNGSVSVGRSIARGDTLGYVGTTGNAPKDTPHLHFQVMRWPADNKYWDGQPIDPYEALGGAPRGSHAQDGNVSPSSSTQRKRPLG
ncbi:MAG TPA: M23 family metallopeptidase, partial [Gemmatimonadaceae bacterium]|nr:M23 family metallopeptidase [Gemmatimonadaceae bacterium]